MRGYIRCSNINTQISRRWTSAKIRLNKLLRFLIKDPLFFLKQYRCVNETLYIPLCDYLVFMQCSDNSLLCFIFQYKRGRNPCIRAYIHMYKVFGYQYTNQSMNERIDKIVTKLLRFSVKKEISSCLIWNIVRIFIPLFTRLSHIYDVRYSTTGCVSYSNDMHA